MILKLKDTSWAAVIDLAWKMQKCIEAQAGRPVDCRTIELLYGPAVAEALVRDYGRSVAKLVPSGRNIEQAYKKVGGSEIRLEEYIRPADALAEKFAAVSGDPYVAVGPKLNVRAQLICHLAHTLEPVARQEFQQQFVWNKRRRRGVFDDTEIATWDELQLQLGMGILASIWHAKQVVPNLTATEFSTALLRKYGIPIWLEGSEVHACHWCGTGPCSCGSGKAPIRLVTYKDAERNLHRGPIDTQEAMYFAYAWANTARGGVGYGPFRALIEAAAEKGMALMNSGEPLDFDCQFGRLVIWTQKHVKEAVTLRTRSEKRRNALLSELADAVHWQFLYGPGILDHVSGIVAALRYVALGINYSEIEIPEILQVI